MKSARKIELIVVHCADTANGRPVAVEEIDRWHRERGFQRRAEAIAAFNPQLTSIGYHYVIQPDGSVQTGRHVDEIGAHALGVNNISLGVCMVGRDKFTPRQWTALKELCAELLDDHQGAELIGHRDVKGVVKQCPGFDVRAWQVRGPSVAHLIVEAAGVTA